MQQACNTLRGVGLAMALVGSMWAYDGWAQSTEPAGPTEPTEPDSTEPNTEPDVGAVMQKLLDISATQPALESDKASRRTFLEARRQANLERLRNAKKDVKQEPEPEKKPAAKPETKQDVKQEAKQEASSNKPVPGPTGLADIDVAFRLDPKVASGSSKEDVWAPAYSGTREGALTVEAKVQGRDAKGQPVDIKPEWRPADPSVEVLPAEGNAVKITVRGSGESNLTVAGPGFSKDLWISATNEGKAIRVRISQ